MKGLKEYYQERFSRIISNEESPLLKQSRFWTDSLILGTRKVLRSEAITIWGEDKGKKKQFGKVYKDEEVDIRSMRQLMVDV